MSDRRRLVVSALTPIACSSLQDHGIHSQPSTPQSLATGHQPPILVPWYISTMVNKPEDSLVVERVQTGVRIEKRLLKVLKGFAEYHDLTLGDLLEGIVLHAFDGKCPFSEESLRRIRDLKRFYGLDLDASASHRLKEAEPGKASRSKGKGK